MAETRIVVETPCEHGQMGRHLLAEYRFDICGGKCGAAHSPADPHFDCPGGSRRVLSDALVVEKVDGEFQIDHLAYDRAGEAYIEALGTSELALRQAIRAYLDALASREELTGDCEIDCQDGCAYPGQFTECELGAASDPDREQP